MQHRTVNDLMTQSVVRVRRDTTFKEVAELLASYDITAMPVLDDREHPVGVVSEADLVHRQAGQPDPAGLLPDRTRHPVRDSEAEPGTAAEVMTSPACVARPEWNVVEAARVMESHRVKRLPVVDETDRLVGILSRADLLRVFLRRDAAIRDEITRDVLDQTLGLAPDQVSVTVEDGRVTLRGEVGSRGLIPVLEQLCQGVDGVVRVRGDLACPAEESRSTAAR